MSQCTQSAATFPMHLGCIVANNNNNTITKAGVYLGNKHFTGMGTKIEFTFLLETDAAATSFMRWWIEDIHKGATPFTIDYTLFGSRDSFLATMTNDLSDKVKGGSTFREVPIQLFIADTGSALGSKFEMSVFTAADNETFTLPVISGYTYDMDINWGDGTTSQITSPTDAELKHTYLRKGTHIIIIRGIMEAFSFKSVPTSATMVTEVFSMGDLGYKYLNGAFSGALNLTRFRLGDASLTAITSLAYAFYNTPKLISVDFSADNMATTLNTTNLIYLNNMFQNSGVETVNLSRLDVAKVTTMSAMFLSASNLKIVDMSGWNTASLVDMANTFNGATDLIEIIGLDGFDTSKIQYMNAGFKYCKRLASIGLSGKSLPALKTIKEAFFSCNTLNDMDISNFNCTTLPQGEFVALFYQNTNLKTVKLPTSTPTITSITSMFHGCEQLTTITNLDVNSFPATLQWASNAFQSCKSLTSITFKTGALDTLAKADRMFYGCEVLTTVNGLGTLANVTTTKQMFYDCYKLISISNTITLASATDTSYMFAYCKSIDYIASENFVMNNVTNASAMFMECRKLRLLIVHNWNISNLTNGSYMFYNLSADLDTYHKVRLKLSNWDVSNVTTFSSFLRGTRLDYPEYDNLLQNWNSQNLKQNVPADFGTSMVYSKAAEAARANMISTDNWAIADGGIAELLLEITIKPNVTVTMSLPSDAYINMPNSEDSFKMLTNQDNTFTDSVGGVVTIASATANDFTITNSNTKITAVKILRANYNYAYYPTLESKFENYTELTTFESQELLDVKSLDKMFKGCTKLTTVNMATTSTNHNWQDAREMFMGCTALTAVPDLGDVSQLTHIDSMYADCTGITDLHLTRDKYTKATSAPYMFRGTNASGILTIADDTFPVLYTGSNMFEGCGGITTFNVGTSLATGVFMRKVFYNCSAMTTLGTSDNRPFENAQYVDSMFEGCNALTELPIIISSSVVSAIKFVYQCQNLVTIGVLNFGDNVYDVERAFSECPKLENLNIVTITSTANNLRAYRAFAVTPKLRNFKLIMRGLKDGRDLFSGASSLTTIDMDDVNAVNNLQVTWGGMFIDCSNLVCISAINTLGMANDRQHMFNGSGALQHPTQDDRIRLVGREGYNYSYAGC